MRVFLWRLNWDVIQLHHFLFHYKN
jgi:hypothetical protein